MNVVLIANRSPWPPINGATIRQYHILKALKERGDEVHVFGFAETGEVERSGREVGAIADSVYLEALSPLRSNFGATRALIDRQRPISVGAYWSASMARQVEACIRMRAPDSLVVHSSNIVSYVPESLKSRSLLDMTDVDSEKFRQYAAIRKGPMSWLYRLEYARLRRYELQAIEEFGVTCLVTEREVDVLTELAPIHRKKVMVIPNGVDTDRFAPEVGRLPIDSLPDEEKKYLAGDGVNLVFTGVMNYPPNVDAACRFAREILPLIRRVHPNARFIVVGSKPSPEVLELGNIEGVRVTGFVEDARPYFRAADVYVLPLRVARGIQNKALEAMACACPIVATSSVSAGVNARHDEQLLIADEPSDFAAKVLALLSDRALAQRLAEAGREHVLGEYAWKPLMQRLLGALDACASITRSSR